MEQHLKGMLVVGGIEPLSLPSHERKPEEAIEGVLPPVDEGNKTPEPRDSDNQSTLRGQIQFLSVS